MARRRATGRFYFLLILLLAVIAYFLYQQMPARETEGIVSVAMSSDTREVEAVIVRDELIVSVEGLEKADFIAGEGDMVSEGETVAEIYTTNYIRRELNRLLEARENVRDYQRTLFAEGTDSTLERLDQNVQIKAIELKNIVDGLSSGNLQNLEKELEEVMQVRQQYLKENRREDTKLMQLYQTEENRVGSIGSWKTTSEAARSGIVSFYFDGYEDILTADAFPTLTADTLRKVYQGDKTIQAQKTKRSEEVYRIVSNDVWYLAILSRDDSWSPVNGQQLSFRMEGFEDVVYNGTVIGVQRSGSDVIIQLSCTDPIGPLLYQRAGKATVGIYTTGLAVPVGALYPQNGQVGVWVQGSYGINFIQVEILSQDKEIAIVQPMQSGALYEGQTVMLYGR